MSDFDLAAALVGTWRLSRRVSGQAEMSGTAIFTPDDFGLRYQESGQIVLSGGQTLEFSRGYLYRFRPGRMEVLFDETAPRLFQSVELIGDATEILGQGFHNCPPDVYVSNYRFLVPSGFSICHRVDGPRKSYDIETDFSRA